MNNAKSLIEFIKASPTAYHTVAVVKAELQKYGFTEIAEKNISAYSDGGRHFVVRGGSSVIAFKGGKNPSGFMICASHTDTPTFKLTSIDEQPTASYSRASVERYGGMINYSWLDRPLSIAGRVTVRDKEGIAVKLVNVDRDLMVIPSVAIHLNRNVNESCKLDPTKDLLPLLGAATDGKELRALVARSAGVLTEDIISYDLFLYNREEGRVLGLSDELVISPRIDNLACVYTSLEAFLMAEEREDTVSVFAAFDNEEVGSETKQGAESTFLEDTLRKIAGSEEKYLSLLADSFMISADNAHARHPNRPELSASEAPSLGGGVVIKYNANQRYTTDAVSDGVFRTIASRAGAPVQSYHNRPDMPGGSTLGSIANTKVSVSTVDIGLPQLAMHSASETLAAADIGYMIKALLEFYSSKVLTDGEKVKVIK